MAAHDFSRLSSIDFEELIHDLLEAEWKFKLEAFAEGRDEGIDLRRTAPDETTIVQCKHYLGSGFPSLLSHIRIKELPKVKKLAPQRYVLVTSVPLTPHNKDELAGVLTPFIRTTADIIGGSEVEDLLRHHPDVEKVHYKLWLTSTAVLERVLHSAERCQTDFQIDRIRRKLPLYVQNDAYPRAVKMLEEARVVVITGQPGIGKSTLAEMLIYAHLEEGYEPVVIQADIGEGRKLYRSDRRQVFYFDDFLGQTYLGDRSEYLGRNQDSALSDFVVMIQNSENARFILTTREHILGGALQRSEKLAHSSLTEQRCVIELADYRRSQKARILYNHLYFSDLPAPYKQAVLAGDFFLKIIDHDNFNPRIIEWLSTFIRIKKVEPENYQAHVMQLLNEPERIWAHAFETQISQAARNILLALYTVGFSDDLVDLEPAWRALHAHGSKLYNYVTSPTDFRVGLKELNGAFVIIRKGNVSFLNPSVRDFLATTLAGSADRVRDILDAATRYRQIGELWQLAKLPKHASLRTYLLDHQALLISGLSRLLHTPITRWHREAYGMVGTPIDYSDTARVRVSLEIAEQTRTPEALAFAQTAFAALIDNWRLTWWGMSSAIEMIRTIRKAEWLLSKIGDAWVRQIVEVIQANMTLSRSEDWIALLESRNHDDFWREIDIPLIDGAFQEYKNHWLDDERMNCDTVSELEELKDNLETLRDKFGQDFQSVISLLEDRIAEKSEEPNEDEEEGTALKWTPSDDFELLLSDENICSIFGTLVE